MLATQLVTIYDVIQELISTIAVDSKKAKILPFTSILATFSGSAFNMGSSELITH